MTNEITLEELYKDRETLLKYNANIDEVDAKIKKLKSTISSGCVETVIGHLPEEIDAPDDCCFVVAAQYVGGKLVKTAYEFNLDLSDKFDNVSEFEDTDDVEDEPGEDSPTRQSTKHGKRVGFTVKFDDGKEIKHQHAVRTMIDALRYMGLERASKFADETFKGYPLIGRKQRPGDRWQKNVDGWWVYVNMSNDRKVECLEGIAKLLNIPMEITWDDASAPTIDFGEITATPAKEKGSHSKFSLNGYEPLAKNHTVWFTVKCLLEEFPTATYDDIAKYFPVQLQGSYGVIRKLKDIEERCKYNKTENRRWFLDPKEILTAGDGTKFAVSKEWGDNFASFIAHAKNELGWTIEEIK